MKKVITIILKILLLIVSILVITFFFTSAGLIKDCSVYLEDKIINVFVSADMKKMVNFSDDHTGIFNDTESSKIINFEWEYNSGTAICSYEEIESQTSDQEEIVKNYNLTFSFIEEKIIYLRQYNLLLGLYE